MLENLFGKEKYISEICYPHTSHSYGGKVWHTIVRQIIPQVYFGGGGIFLPFTPAWLVTASFVLNSGAC